MSHSGTALARFPAFLLNQAEQLGLERSWLLEQAQLSEEDLVDPDSRVQAGKHIQLWRVVLDAVEDRDLGIRLGSAIRAKDVGLVGYTMLHSATLGDALARLVRFGRIIDETYPPEVRVQRGETMYRVEPLPEQRLSMERLADFDLAGLLAVLRELAGVEIVPAAIHFPYRSPSSDLTTFRSFFGGELLFDQPDIALVFKNQTLRLPVRTADPALGTYLDQLAENVVETLAPGGSMSDKVERALWAEIKDGRPQLDSVAKALAMSPRTLQRRLREEETSFAELLDRFRHEMSLQLLGDRELAIYEIAYLLGYSEPSTFYRAFRRWTGASPQEVRGSEGREPDGLGHE